MATLDDLRQLGYTVALAHGSVEVEEQALAAAREAADPNVVVAQANQVANDTVQTLANIGKLPENETERLQLATEIGKAALEQLTERVTERVAFHERAVAIATDSPDVWFVAHDSNGASCVQLYVAAKADGTGWDDAQQELLDALADPAAYAEREWQVAHQDALAAAATLIARGQTVTREPGQNGFTVDGKQLTCKQVLAAAAALQG